MPHAATHLRLATALYLAYISPISPYISPLPSVSHPAPRTYPAPRTASDNNRFTGGLEPLQDATALRELFVSNNQLSGDLAPIRRCVLLQELFCSRGAQGCYGPVTWST